MRGTVFVVATLAAAVSLAVIPHAAAQSGKAIKIVVPFAPGGGIDVVARVIAEQIGNLQGPTIIVENRPGAGTVIATEDVLRATPDGGTLLFNNNSFVVVPQFRKLNYNALADLTAVCEIANTPTVVVVSNDSLYYSLDDLIAAARAKPDELTFGAVPGAVLHIGFEMLQRGADVRMTLVPYTGTIPEVTAVLGGQINAAMVDYPAAAGQLQAGKLRALAIGAAARAEWLPNVPTMLELGFKDYVNLWYGIFAPAKTPPETVSRLADWFVKALQATATKSRLLAQGVAPVGLCGAEFGAFVRKEYDAYGRVIRAANIKAE